MQPSESSTSSKLLSPPHASLRPASCFQLQLPVRQDLALALGIAQSRGHYLQKLALGYTHNHYGFIWGADAVNLYLRRQVE